MKNNKKGFTLAELLIVVAIIAVLVAISIPIFTAQLRKARLATNQANARAAYAATVADMLDRQYTSETAVYDVPTARISGTPTATATHGSITSAITKWSVSYKSMGDKQFNKWTVAIDKNGKVTFAAQ